MADLSNLFGHDDLKDIILMEMVSDDDICPDGRTYKQVREDDEWLASGKWMTEFTEEQMQDHRERFWDAYPPSKHKDTDNG